MPVTLLLVAAYMLSITVVTADPSGPWSTVLSMFPPTAPLAMPIRWASGTAPTYQLILAMVLTAGTAVLFAAIASAVYQRALLITGHRVKLRELTGRSAAA